MKQVYLTILALICLQVSVYSQRIAQVPDSVRKKYQASQQSNAKSNKVFDISKLDQDSLIKVKLIEIAQRNAEITMADASIRIAEANLDLAKKSWLSSFVAGANINEFVVNSSPLANFFPKYNLGIAVPFDILARVKREKRVAQENLLISQETKGEKLRLLKAEVLIRYETYKEKKELVLLQKNSLEYDYSAYLAAQKAYADAEIKIELMDKAYQSYLGEKVKLVGKELDLKIATIQLEQLIGIPLSEATDQALKL